MAELDMAKINAEEAEKREHPELYRLILKCPECGNEREFECPKEDCQKYVDRHGTDILPSLCSKCEDVDDDE